VSDTLPAAESVPETVSQAVPDHRWRHLLPRGHQLLGV